MTLSGQRCAKLENTMGIFSFNSDFDVKVSHPQEVAFENFLSYVNKNRSLKLTESEKCQKLAFTKSTSLFSWPIDFEITFKGIDENTTQLSVKSESGTIDFGKAKGMINDIVKEIY